MLIYDVEIKKAIPFKNAPRIEGIDYCGGWNDYVNMGISVVGVYDYSTDQRLRQRLGHYRQELFIESLRKPNKYRAKETTRPAMFNGCRTCTFHT